MRIQAQMYIPALFASSILLSAAACADQPASKDLDFFERRIRPVLIARCYECHSGVGEKEKEELNLTFRDGLLRGGENGPAIVPGKPEDSLLIKALQYESLEMPPKGKLSDAVIDDFVKWIKMGAPDPRAKEAGDNAGTKSQQIAADNLWSLRPLQKVEPPKMEGVEHAIDRFVLARLQQNEIPAAPRADEHVLLRRLYFDLTGLPPGEAAIAKVAPLDEVVDRLLESAEFGERWARHWLDLTAYADTIGVGRAIPALEAWRYRDYVIGAFNTDKPFDQFVREQLAGDITVPPGPQSPGGDPPTADSIIATGFLAIGPWELVSGDKAQLRMDVVDKQVHRVGQTLLGLTFGCARCHDHKFDPVSQRDYYALAGLFSSTVTLNGRIGGVFSSINETPLPEASQDLLARAQRVKAYEAEVAVATRARDAAAAKVTELKKQIESVNADQRAELEMRRAAVAAEAKRNADRLNVLKYLRIHRTQTRALSLKDAPEPQACRINIRGNAHMLGELVPRGFPAAIAPKSKPAFTRGGSGRVQLADWITDEENPLTARVWVNRVWHHLFGAGLVRTVDNFGARGETPSHPELLDYLAAEFMRDGWSTKRLIRRIVLSQTWQQAAVNEAALKRGVAHFDPDNRLLWRANRRRLEAEAIRDAMLAVSGQLLNERGGPTLPLDYPGNLSTALTGSLGPGAKFSDELKLRRSIYQPQKRKAPFDALDFLAAFDLPDPSEETGRRSETTVPTQALYLLNSDFVKQCAAATAESLASITDAPTRVSTIYLTVFGRAPSDDEMKETLAFISRLQTGDAGPESEAWSKLCQSLLISNEFLFRE